MKLIVISILIQLHSLVFAINTVSTGFQVPAGGSMEINVHSVCRRVINNRASAVFVPTKTATEWASFVAGSLASVSVVSCCSGYSYGGYCYRSAALGASCTTACAAKGGCNATGVNYIGHGGTLARCKAVLDGLGMAPIGGDPLDSNAAGYTTLGCVTIDGGEYGFYRYRLYGATTSCGSADASYARVCACAY